MLRDKYHFDKWSEAIRRYTGDDWTAADLAYLYARAVSETEPDLADLNWLRKKTSLLPPNLLPQIDEAWLISNAPRSKDATPATRSVPIKIIEGRFTDDEFKDFFKPRTQEDLNIRRGRARTVYMMYEGKKMTTEWRRWIIRLTHFDYITVCNLLMFHIYHGDWLDFWAKTDALRVGVSSLQLVTKWASDALKKMPATMELRLRYCEAGGVSGYRNPPFEGFDFLAETKKLAEGGEPHGVGAWEETFEKAATEVQGASVVKPLDFMTLEEFIASDLAQTHGASSFGKVEWEFEGEHGKFKARKNFLLDIATPEYLAEQVWEHLGRQVSTSFIKPELGKMRIAVTGDIWSYYSQAYLNWLCNGVYLEWPGNTLDESVVQQCKRMLAMFDALHLSYGLSFDHAAFDHQALTSEIVKLSGLYLARGKDNVPAWYLSTWQKLYDGTLQSFNHSTIKATFEGKLHEYTVSGGLASGIRLTSLIGNYWNGTITREVKNMLPLLETQIDSWLRGDDSVIVGPSYWHTLLFRLG